MTREEYIKNKIIESSLLVVEQANTHYSTKIIEFYHNSIAISAARS